MERNKSLKVLIGVFVVILSLFGCKKEEHKTLIAPNLSTTEVTEVRMTTAKCGVNIIDDGGTPIIASGICWSTQNQPTISDNFTVNGNDVSTYLITLENLTPNTTYYVRAYATNSVGTSYGEEKSFTTFVLMDIEGNGYHTITIGTQVWLVENLKTTKYRNGDNIPKITDNTIWSNQTTGAYCWFNNDETTQKNKYGVLYNYYALEDNRNLCPLGWHVSTDAEWKTLEIYLGMTQKGADSIGWRGTDQGSKLKSNSAWGAGGNETNSSGFTALPGGERDAINGSLFVYGSFGAWWCSGNNDFLIYFRSMLSNENRVFRSGNIKKSGLSVRCVKDN